MDEKKGVTGGIILMILTGLIFKGTVTSSPQAPPEPNRSTAKPATNKAAAGRKGVVTPANEEGPWQASCAYWSPIKRPMMDAAERETSCGTADAQWGIPDARAGEHVPEISAIIATVPDPIHSHLALDFDRTVDTLLLAASDNQYLSSYYWLPWRARTNASSKQESGKREEDPDQEERDKRRERQPGLIILRYRPDDDKWRLKKPQGEQKSDAERKEEEEQRKDRGIFSRTAYHRVIYLFLVAETPALGVNGVQLQNAFLYEQMLRQEYGAALSVRPSPFGKPGIGKPGTDDTLSIIGPLFSGSAASLHEGIESSGLNPKPTKVSIAGATSTSIAMRLLDPEDEGVYHSFGENVNYEQKRFLQSLKHSGYDLNRVAVLSEAGTVFGSAQRVKSEAKDGAKRKENDKDKEDEELSRAPLSLRFPRELSLLRNAQASGAKPETGAPTPFLNLTLKDYASSDDTEPRFSETQSPLSVEAQLMALAHQLQRSQIQFIVISASNILDDIFLAQFLHRACPDARIVTISGGDLLFERDTDNAPYVGSISISPYLLTMLNKDEPNQWLYSDGQSAAVYNAANYILWDRTADPSPFAGYIDSSGLLRMPLWAVANGKDGYYPLALLHPCASDTSSILPSMKAEPERGAARDPLCIKEHVESTAPADVIPPPSSTSVYPIARRAGINPSLVWGVIAMTLLIACLGHAALIFSAQYWSPFTRDLAIDENDEPRRRTVYICIGTAMLCSMAYVTAFPLLRVAAVCHTSLISQFLAGGLLISALLALLSTFIKTRGYLGNGECREYLFFNNLAVVTLLFVIIAWTCICLTDHSSIPSGDSTGGQNFAGLYFSYRCLEPFSGVCPLVPVLLLMAAWFLWSICQTSRLRFSEMNRPRVPHFVPSSNRDSLLKTPYPLYVPEEALERCERPTDSCLYKNITTLLITLEVVRRFCRAFEKHSSKLVQRISSWIERQLMPLLVTGYVVLFFVLILLVAQITSLDHFAFPTITVFGKGSQLTLYEFLVVALFYPLIMVTISGWLRAILVWGSLSRGLLEPLERAPLRCAFSRVRSGSWVSMIRQSGLNIRWKDMSRSTEAIRQIVHHPDVQKDAKFKSLIHKNEEMNWYVGLLVLHVGGKDVWGNEINLEEHLIPRPAKGKDDGCTDELSDLGHYPNITDICFIRAIEGCYAEFCQLLLEKVLVPYWDTNRLGFVEDCKCAWDIEAAATVAEEPKPADDKDEKKCKQPTLIAMAEELLVVRYIALIRAVLVNVRYLMVFVAAVFVLSLVAWNSYPFQPHGFIDWCFTFLLLIISTGFVAMFAQMHRNAILSRITDTKPNELGWDFWIRLITFGAVPVLTWLAYQFPQIGGSLYRVVQPGLQVVK
jgi:hypothetical protein